MLGMLFFIFASCEPLISPVLDAGGKPEDPGKPAEASMEWKPNAHTDWNLESNSGSVMHSARREPLRYISKSIYL